MAKVYMEKLSRLIEKLDIKKETTAHIEIKHFFSGAAIYANSKICVSWSPKGLAFKLSEDEASKLIEAGEAKPLKYFEKGNIKKGYVVFEKPDNLKDSIRKGYLLKAVRYYE